jgi:hypothetical protein
MGRVRLRMRWDPKRCELVEVPLESMQRRPSEAPVVHGDYEGYTSPITGEWIEGRRAHREDLKRHGCRVYEGRESEQRAATRVQAEHARQTEQLAEKMAARAWDQAPTRVRRILSGGKE